MADIKGKGKERAEQTSPSIPPLPNPSAGSANPSASLSALWGYIQPAVNHLVRSPSNDPRKAPSIDIEYHMGIHTATYNYFTTQSESGNALFRHANIASETSASSGADLYEQLDIYLTETARELFLAAPQDDSTLIHYIVPCFHRYSAGAHSVNRLLNYVNRHYVKRAIDEDKGWFRLADVLESIAKNITATDTPEQLSKILREKRTEELKKWGFEEGGPAELLSQAEACAEAGSPPDRVVSVSSLAHRRFRTEFVDPLLAVPKIKAKGKAKNKKTAQPPAMSGPKSRLARAVKELLESETGNREERGWLAAELAKTLKMVGVRAEHPLRKRLDKFVEAGSERDR
jgi:hypothetical protein